MTRDEEFDLIVFHNYRANSVPRVWPFDPIKEPHVRES